MAKNMDGDCGGGMDNVMAGVVDGCSRNVDSVKEWDRSLADDEVCKGGVW